MSERLGPIVAGVDHSRASEAAVACAAAQAGRRHLPLLLVHGYLVPTPTLTPMPPLYDEHELTASARMMLEAAVARTRSTHPDLVISTKIVAGSGGQALVAESLTASLVVVGSRGAGGFLGVLVGSVAAQVGRHAHCPVLVVREPAAGSRPATGRVVVGVDGSAQSTVALAFAFEEAQARGSALIAVHVWSVAQLSARSVGTVWSPNLLTARSQLHEVAERVLVEALAGWPQKYPDVDVRSWTVHGDDPARTLLSTADEIDADLLVVGSRGRDGLSGLVLGSVSQAVVTHATGSVAVVHAGHQNG